MEANYFTILYWFCHTLTWISHGCTCVPHPEPPSHLPPQPIPQGHPSATALSTLSHASNLDWRSVSHMVIYMFQCYSLKSSHPRLLPQSPKDCSMHLCLFCCLAYRIIVTIFLNSIDMRSVQFTSVTQSCLTLCDPVDCSLSGFSVPGILQARTLEWVAISFSNAWKWKVKVKSLSCVWLLATPWTAAYQAPPSMGFSGQQYWSGVPLPSPKATRLPNEDLLDTNPRSEHMTSSKLFHCIEGWKKHLSFRDDVWKLSGP